MDIKVSEKKADKIKNKVLEAINRANQYGIPLESIGYKAELEASNAIQSINAEIETMSNDDIFLKITGNNWYVPEQMAFNYWIHINLWGELNINRFNFICDDDDLKQTVKKICKHACIFGRAVFVNENEYGVVVNETHDLWTGAVKSLSIAPLPMNATDIVCGSVNGNAKITLKDPNNKNVKVIKDPNKTAILCWRDNGIGDYVYALQNICLDLYKKQTIDCNAKNLIRVPSVKISSLSNFYTENKWNNNPYNSCKLTIAGEQNGLINKWENDTSGNDGWILRLHEDLRFHQEYYYDLFGLEVSNSKNVVLSSDANLGFARAQYITKERFERVEAFVNKIAKLTGKNISVEMYKIPDMGVANQNRSGIMKDEIPKERENE